MLSDLRTLYERSEQYAAQIDAVLMAWLASSRIEASDDAPLAAFRDLCAYAYTIGTEVEIAPTDALDAKDAEIARLREREHGYQAEINEVEQVLGRALGYSRYGDDPVNWPHLVDSPDVCVGDNSPASLADEAAQRIERLKGALREARWTVEDPALLHDIDAQLRETEARGE